MNTQASQPPLTIQQPARATRVTCRLAVAMGLALVIGVLTSTTRLRAQVALDAEAASGVPFGVGRVTLRSGGEFRVNRLARPGGQRGGRIADLAKRIADQVATNNNNPPTNLKMAEMAVSERSGRVVYPVFEKRDRPVLREFIAVPTQTAIYFLFQGDAPLELTVYTPEPQVVRIAPRADANSYDRLLRSWWTDFSAAADGRSAPKDFPPLVEEYLTDTLARRMRLPLPDRAPLKDAGIFQSELNLLMGTEAARLELMRAVLTSAVDHEAASLPLPHELPPPKPEMLNPTDVKIEPLAMHVPSDCLYVHFGNFPNFLWLRHRMEDWGGQLRDVISERGVDYALNDRMQRQLGLQESTLAEVLGPQVIADVALVGTDTFLREGAAIGLLFQAKSNPALSANFMQQRLAAAREAKNAKQEKLTIAGHSVSFFSTPDNRLRSFYVVDGDFHLVTTSRAIVEQFLATGAGQHEALGATDEFRLARQRMPLARNDTLFVYLSPQFFQNLLSIQYHVELERRLRSAVEIELVDLARLAARAEGKSVDAVDDLVAAGLLPASFGNRPDGSQLKMLGNELGDSLRGARGTFLPVPDMVIEKITPTEARDYAQFSQYYSSTWGPMDPVVVAVSRQAIATGNLERVVVDIEAAPLSQRHIDMLAKWLGPPTDQRLASVPGDVVAFEAVLRGGTFFSGGDHHLFGALRDADPNIALDPRANLIARIFTSRLDGLQGYVGAWPNPGFLRLLSIGSNPRSNAGGYTQLLTGLSRRQFDDFTLMSFHPEILELVSPQLRFEQAPRPAQIWFRSDDLSRSKLAPMINAYGYRQSRQITQGNTRFMNMLTEQLHVPPAEARATAERLLEAKLVDPLGGQYELSEYPGGLKTWTSTALANLGESAVPPADYQFPALNWLRETQFEIRTENGLLALHGEVVMPVETRAAPAGFKLPGLPFGTPTKPPKPTTAEPPKGHNPAKQKASGPRQF